MPILKSNAKLALIICLAIVFLAALGGVGYYVYWLPAPMHVIKALDARDPKAANYELSRLATSDPDHKELPQLRERLRKLVAELDGQQDGQQKKFDFGTKDKKNNQAAQGERSSGQCDSLCKLRELKAIAAKDRTKRFDVQRHLRTSLSDIGPELNKANDDEQRLEILQRAQQLLLVAYGEVKEIPPADLGRFRAYQRIERAIVMGRPYHRASLKMAKSRLGLPVRALNDVFYAAQEPKTRAQVVFVVRGDWVQATIVRLPSARTRREKRRLSGLLSELSGVGFPLRGANRRASKEALRHKSTCIKSPTCAAGAHGEEYQSWMASGQKMGVVYWDGAKRYMHFGDIRYGEGGHPEQLERLLR